MQSDGIIDLNESNLQSFINHNKNQTEEVSGFKEIFLKGT